MSRRLGNPDGGFRRKYEAGRAPLQWLRRDGQSSSHEPPPRAALDPRGWCGAGYARHQQTSRGMTMTPRRTSLFTILAVVVVWCGLAAFGLALAAAGATKPFPGFG